MRAVRRVGFSLVSSRRFFGKAGAKVASPPLVVITGEEFTRYAGVSDQRSFCVALKVFFFFFSLFLAWQELYLEKWIRPYVDTSQWEYYDLSCKARDSTKDQVLRDAIAAGKRVGAIYKVC